MREFLPHGENPDVSKVLFEQYGRTPLEIAEEYFSSNESTWHLSYYLTCEVMPSLEDRGYLAHNEGEDDQFYKRANLTQPLEAELERKGVMSYLREEYDENVPVLKPDNGNTEAEKIKFIYAVAEHVGKLIDQQKTFQNNRQESVIVPPIFDEGIFSSGR